MSDALRYDPDDPATPIPPAPPSPPDHLPGDLGIDPEFMRPKPRRDDIGEDPSDTEPSA